MFARLRGEGRLALIAYLTVGYPRPALTPALVDAAAGAGADAIELGIPFSDPLADGRTIQAASQLALKAGVTVAHALESAKAARALTWCSSSRPPAALRRSRRPAELRPGSSTASPSPGSPERERSWIRPSCRSSRRCAGIRPCRSWSALGSRNGSI